MEFIDLKAQYESIKAKIDSNIKEVLNSSKFIGGTQISILEERLQMYTGRKHCLTCGNGTDALQLAFTTLGVKEGDAVFCPDMTFIASIEPACMLGATPVFVDIDIDSYNINPKELEKKIQEVLEAGELIPKVVVCVDFLGNPAQMEEIQDICKKYNIYMIEDAAQAMGASHRGKKCGSFGDIACTSFFPSKPLGCYGDGGAVFTDNDEYAEIINSIKVHGKGKSKYDNIRIGINSRLDTIQAAVLLAKLDVLDEEIGIRQKIAQYYDMAFDKNVKVPSIAEENISSYAQYCLLFDEEKERDKVMKSLKERDIPSLIYYPNALHSLPVFKDAKSESLECYKNSNKYAKCNLGLPFSPYLKKSDQEMIINVVLSAINLK